MAYLHTDNLEVKERNRRSGIYLAGNVILIQMLFEQNDDFRGGNEGKSLQNTG